MNVTNNVNNVSATNTQLVPVDTISTLISTFDVKTARWKELKDYRVEFLPSSIVLSDDLSVWVNGIKVRTRFDARYTKYGWNDFHKNDMKKEQVLSVLFSSSRITVYLDRNPLLVYKFSQYDREYQEVLSRDIYHPQLFNSYRLNSEVWPMIQM